MWSVWLVFCDCGFHSTVQWRTTRPFRTNTKKRCPFHHAAAAAKSLQLCPTLCDTIDGSPPGSPIPGILQARTLEWVAISFSNAWKWSSSVVSDSSWPHGLQPTRLPRPWDFPGKCTGVGCHHLLRLFNLLFNIFVDSDHILWHVIKKPSLSSLVFIFRHSDLSLALPFSVLLSLWSLTLL